jgi:large subunit ribosomal protein L6
MSRIGKKPIPLPAGVKYTVSENGSTVLVEGPKGKVTAMLPGGITLVKKDGTLVAERESDKQAAFHGLARALVFNAVTGVTTGWTKDLDIVGIGYRAEMKGKNMVVFTLGYSHPIEFPLPTGIEVAIDPKQTHLTISGIDRQKVGQVAADMRSLRPPDPYKQKGIRITGERLKKKAGKAGAKAGGA